MFPSPAATRTIQRDCNKESTMISESATILIVEDEQDIRELLAYNLEKEGYATVQAADGKEGLDLARSRKPDLILLDLMLPKMDGLAVCRELERDSGTVRIPIIMLTARGEDVDRILGFELGADDYITKPFSLAVLRARVNTQLRRTAAPQAERVQLDGFTFDFGRMEFSRNGVPVELSKTEQKLLRLLVEHRGQTLTRAALVDRIWTDGAEYVDENALSVTVKRLRDKLEDMPSKPRYIKTVYGLGYTWAVN